MPESHLAEIVMPEKTYMIRKDDGTGTAMTYDEVVHGVAQALSYKFGHSLGWDVEGRVIHEAAKSAVHWLEASLETI
jgi:hypothetical protein